MMQVNKWIIYNLHKDKILYLCLKNPIPIEQPESIYIKPREFIIPFVFPTLELDDIYFRWHGNKRKMPWNSKDTRFKVEILSKKDSTNDQLS